MSETLEGLEFIGELPQSDHPWEMRRYGDIVYLSNPDHPLHMIVNGKLETIESKLMNAMLELTDDLAIHGQCWLDADGNRISPAEIYLR